MELNFDAFDTGEFLQKVIHTAASNVPFHAGTVINYVVDTLFFTKSDQQQSEAMWNKVEKYVSALTVVQLNDAVEQALGQMTAASMFGKLKSFGTQFRQLLYITNVEQRKLQLSLLTNEASHLVGDMVNVPAGSLHKMARPLQIIAGCHIAAVMQLKTLEPDNYRHQSSLNNLAILYSDTAKIMYDRSMGWRRGMIAEGKGVLHQMDWAPTKQEALREEMKRVQFEAYDKYFNGILQPGKGEVVVSVFTPDIPKNRPSPEYGDTEIKAYAELGKYDEKVKLEWTAFWNTTLLNVTKEFMNLVDWPRYEQEKKGQLKPQPNHFAYPLRPSASPLHTADNLQRIDLFLEQQMDHFALSGPRYAQTYRPDVPVFYGDQTNLFLRADTYDSAVACIYFQERGNLARAQDLGDALVQALNHDPLGGGRIVAATIYGRLVDPDQNFRTSIFTPDGGVRDVGNMSWAGIALTRLFAKTGLHRYLHAAETIGQWIIAECTVADAWGGFSGGEDHWKNKRLWRSVEHNVDCVSFFDNLHALTGKSDWAAARESARKLVKACQTQVGYYVTGTGEGMVLNSGVVPTDTQSWTALARIDPEPDKRSLNFMIDIMGTTSEGFAGTKFAQRGAGVQNEATAGAAMALWMARDKSDRFKTTAERWLDSLGRQITSAKRATGYGVVATPANEADTGEGLGWKYFNYQHVASSAWTGLAFLFKDKPSANPYAPIDIVRGG